MGKYLTKTYKELSEPLSDAKGKAMGKLLMQKA